MESHQGFCHVSPSGILSERVEYMMRNLPFSVLLTTAEGLARKQCINAYVVSHLCNVDQIVRHMTMTRALDYDTYCNPSCRHHKLVMMKMANFELPTASFYPIGTSLIGIARPTGLVFFLDGIQGSTNEWFLGCENPTSELPLAAEGEFTQPRNHSLAEPCIFRLHLHRALTLLHCLFKTSK